MTDYRLDDYDDPIPGVTFDYGGRRAEYVRPTAVTDDRADLSPLCDVDGCEQPMGHALPHGDATPDRADLDRTLVMALDYVTGTTGGANRPMPTQVQVVAALHEARAALATPDRADLDLAQVKSAYRLAAEASHDTEGLMQALTDRLNVYVHVNADNAARLATPDDRVSL